MDEEAKAAVAASLQSISERAPALDKICKDFRHVDYKAAEARERRAFREGRLWDKALYAVGLRKRHSDSSQLRKQWSGCQFAVLQSRATALDRRCNATLQVSSRLSAAVVETMRDCELVVRYFEVKLEHVDQHGLAKTQEGRALRDELNRVFEPQRDLLTYYEYYVLPLNDAQLQDFDLDGERARQLRQTMANHIRSIRGQWKDPAAVDTRTSHHNTDEKQVDRNIDRTNPLQHGTATTRLSHMGRFLAWTLFAYGRARVQALCVACEEGDTAKAAKLLATGVYVDGRDDQQITPLVWAIRHRHWEIVKLLLSYHANPNCSAPMTPLLEAVSSKRMDIVEVLVKNGAVVNAKDLSNERFRGITALHRAVELDLQDIVYFLLSQGADCKLTYCDHTADLHNISPLHIAKGRCAHHIKTSTERDYDWFRASAKDSQGRIPLFWALERNDWEAVASCLPHHSTAKDSIDVHGNSALHLLCDILSSSHLPRDLIWVTSLVLSVDREVIRRPNNAGKFPLQMLAASAANRSQHQRSDDESVFKACKDDILATDLASQHRIRHPEDYMDSYITYCFGTAPTPTKEELEERHCKWELQQAHEAQTLAEQTAYFSSLMEQQKDDSERQNNKSEKEQRHII